MEQTNAREFISMAFQKCAERGWLNELAASTISPQDIADFEAEQKVCLPSLYKAFLTAYQLPEDVFQMCGITHHLDETFHRRSRGHRTDRRHRYQKAAGCAVNLMVASRDGETVDIEVSTDDFDVLYPQDSIIVHTNQFVPARFDRKKERAICWPEQP